MRVKNEVWTAETSYGTIIKAGERVRVVRMEGIILVVAPVQKSEVQTSPKDGK